VLYAHFDAQRTQLLESSLQLLQMETAAPGLGSNLVISRLADIVFVQAIRAHAAEGEAQDSGWLSAVTEKKIGAALRAMHKEPARAWTVEALAAIATLSRSAFAARFKERVGESPLAYLTRWRMFRAACLLRQSDKPQAEIAGVVGYETEAAFSKAFKRATGIAPGAYRRGEAVRIDVSPTVPSALLGNHPAADQRAYN
jgi:transcriptional regulator GlxA family with amidase domain